LVPNRKACYQNPYDKNQANLIIYFEQKKTRKYTKHDNTNKQKQRKRNLILKYYYYCKQKQCHLIVFMICTFEGCKKLACWGWLGWLGLLGLAWLGWLGWPRWLGNGLGVAWAAFTIRELSGNYPGYKGWALWAGWAAG